MHQSLCVCALVPRVETRTRVVLVIHRSEDRKPTNTGRLATLCLPNSEVVVRGHQEAPTDTLPLGERPLLLFPADDAVVLEPEMARGGPVTLVVPDGTWRQASKVRARVPALRGVPCVRLAAGAPSIYRLRAEAHAHGLATFEAIARALAVLEGPEIGRALEGPFRAMVERTLWSRGDLDDDDVAAGIPSGALRHDPTSGAAASGTSREG
jgi:tRNA-uridine aminocarboxypropyltransferase